MWSESISVLNPYEAIVGSKKADSTSSKTESKPISNNQPKRQEKKGNEA